jgi:ribonuclease HI
MSVKIYVDGACSGNPGRGGYGCIVKNELKYTEFFGAETYATNNRMEILGAIVALESLKSHSLQIEVFSDSQYLVKGMNGWVYDWIKNGWRNSKRQPTPNKDLWLVLIGLAKKHIITWTWIKGHAGHPENERCDQLAKLALTEA